MAGDRSVARPAEGTPAPSKKAVPAKGTTPEESTPEEIATAGHLPPVPAPAGRVSVAPPDPWNALLADPGHAPEFLALTAVRIFGPQAAAWAAETSARYPNASAQALARLATEHFVRLGRLSSVAAAATGLLAPAALLGSAAINQARLALHVAAAYRKDPARPERAAELLVIAEIHPSVGVAQAAIDAARRGEHAGHRPPLQGIGGWMAAGLAARWFPGVSLLTAALSGDAVVRRTRMFYRNQLSRDSGSSA